MADDNCIEPACSSGSACGSTELAAYVSDLVADLVIKLCWERSLAYTGSVSLGNTDNVCDDLWSYACTNAHTC